MRAWSERRRRAWRWAWAALAAGVLLAPIGSETTCADTTTTVGVDGGCQVSRFPALGLILPIRYPAP